VLAGEKARLGRTIAGVWLHDRLAEGLEYVAGEEVCERVLETRARGERGRRGFVSLASGGMLGSRAVRRNSRQGWCCVGGWKVLCC
jgi:hypothetical protein